MVEIAVLAGGINQCGRCRIAGQFALITAGRPQGAHLLTKGLLNAATGAGALVRAKVRPGNCLIRPAHLIARRRLASVGSVGLAQLLQQGAKGLPDKATPHCFIA